MGARLTGRARGGLVAASLLAAWPAVAGPRDGFSVIVVMTPLAAERLTREHEGVVVSAWYYADPKKGKERQANPVGLIDVGNEEAVLDGAGGQVEITGGTIDPATFGLIGGPLQVNVNVWSARRAEPDNLLACDFFDGALTRAQVSPVELRCGLIVEGVKTEAKS